MRDLIQSAFYPDVPNGSGTFCLELWTFRARVSEMRSIWTKFAQGRASSLNILPHTRRHAVVDHSRHACVSFRAFGGDFYGSLGIPHWVPCSKSRGLPPDHIRLPSCAVCGQCFESLRVTLLYLASLPLVVGAVFPSLVIYRRNLAVRAAA